MPLYVNEIETLALASSNCHFDGLTRLRGRFFFLSLVPFLSINQRCRLGLDFFFLFMRPVFACQLLSVALARERDKRVDRKETAGTVFG